MQLLNGVDASFDRLAHYKHPHPLVIAPSPLQYGLLDNFVLRAELDLDSRQTGCSEIQRIP